LKAYINLEKASKDKLVSVAERLERSGITVKEALKLSDLDLRKSVGFKGKKTSFEGFKRNVKEIGLTLERKQGILKDALPKYAKIGYIGKGLNLAKVRLDKIIGLNVFFDIAKEVQNKFGLTVSESYNKTSNMLQIAKFDFNQLSKSEKIILEFFS